MTPCSLAKNSETFRGSLPPPASGKKHILICTVTFSGAIDISSFKNCGLPVCSVLMSQDGRTRLPSSETELIPAVHDNDKQNADRKVIKCRREFYLVASFEAVDNGRMR